ncbi:MAG: isocitrate lyase/phosphoenolpyruvate mutase family protein [Gammaproteobacteria bacterium]|nr:isocitrate lyase/phosphoenolpyruvate mutase family protein [Gammaproteobacteria bacterium]MCF6260818.1 isocitrate lyase/phosphoenolpyruvate mutase family protein [Gammaproteobacteria bacterium]
MTTSTKHKAKVFRNLSTQGHLLLPNAWDAASARIFEAAGFPAIGTTSAGIAYSRGFRDAQQISREEMVHEVAIIARAVDIPVTADIEAGYGTGTDDVAETVRAVIDAGAVGINLEDNTHGGTLPLFDISTQAERIAAAKSAGEQSRITLTINARTDVFLLELGIDESERTSMAIERGHAYLAAGADLVFVPALIDTHITQHLSDAFGGRLNLMAMPRAPAASVLFDAGAQRVSLGPSAMLASLGTVQNIAQELQQTGTWSSIEASFFGFSEAETLFKHG